MDGCFRVYVVNTTDALLLFFKQRNLEITSQSVGTPDRRRRKRVSTSACPEGPTWPVPRATHRGHQPGPSHGPATPGSPKVYGRGELT